MFFRNSKLNIFNTISGFAKASKNAQVACFSKHKISHKMSLLQYHNIHTQIGYFSRNSSMSGSNQFSLNQNNLNSINTNQYARQIKLYQSVKKTFSTAKAKKDKTPENQEDQLNEEIKETKVDVKSEGRKSSQANESSSSSSSSDEGELDSKLKAKYNNLTDLYNDQGAKLEFTKAKYVELRDAYVQKKTEADNMKLRVEKEKVNAKEYAITKFVKDLLDISDNFHRAFDSIKETDFSKMNEEEKVKSFKDFSEGLLMNHNSFKKCLKKNTLNEIGSEGQIYDPDKHTVTNNYEDASKKSNEIGKVNAVGYIFNNKNVLRKAKVEVVRNPSKAAKNDKQEEKAESKNNEESQNKE